MAKRKRLTLPHLQDDAADPAQRAPEVKSLGGAPALSGGLIADPAPTSRPAPIAQVAGDAANSAALETLAEEMRAARESGRMVLALPLDSIDMGWLIRDRMAADAVELDDLKTSLRDRGQQTPIEVVTLEGGRYGLISGWRRLTAMRALRDSEGDGFATIQALLRRPETAADAYRAMVEENEIRVGLSYFERARICALAARAGVHRDARGAVQELFAAASRAKKSKIASFVTIFEALEGRLAFPGAITERLGLTLARRLEETPDFGARLRDRLRKAAPETAAEELALITRAMDGLPEPEAQPETAPDAETMRAAQGHTGTDVVDTPTPKDKSLKAPIVTVPAPEGVAAAVPETAPPTGRTDVFEPVPGVVMQTTGGFSRATIMLSGPKVDGPLCERLIAWLKAGGKWPDE
ncbi:ParB N-terminal domain-containing protein [Roseicitreum antarcticum]|uniref:Chromosome segregation protein Spo0J, contains ParB-like nuclease domain n=1 Tax=Roseicitreum antarcticum TaxID=564137 RepID=A0A1H3CT51_9RHOB|nr:ParB N-terminal domain-containing protein [Roseicitreum antarcticum]SDX56589.1 Chromosome segregation protein Spo0J, contains ParB-like nuclease domain [Roseicitreum antarcticum]